MNGSHPKRRDPRRQAAHSCAGDVIVTEVLIYVGSGIVGYLFAVVIGITLESLGGWLRRRGCRRGPVKVVIDKALSFVPAGSVHQVLRKLGTLNV